MVCEVPAAVRRPARHITISGISQNYYPKTSKTLVCELPCLGTGRLAGPGDPAPVTGPDSRDTQAVQTYKSVTREPHVSYNALRRTGTLRLVKPWCAYCPAWAQARSASAFDTRSIGRVNINAGNPRAAFNVFFISGISQA